jgi:hypothetical protein
MNFDANPIEVFLVLNETTTMSPSTIFILLSFKKILISFFLHF